MVFDEIKNDNGITSSPPPNTEIIGSRLNNSKFLKKRVICLCTTLTIFAICIIRIFIIIYGFRSISLSHFSIEHIKLVAPSKNDLSDFKKYSLQIKVNFSNSVFPLNLDLKGINMSLSTENRKDKMKSRIEYIANNDTSNIGSHIAFNVSNITFYKSDSLLFDVNLNLVSFVLDRSFSELLASDFTFKAEFIARARFCYIPLWCSKVIYRSREDLVKKGNTPMNLGFISYRINNLLPIPCLQIGLKKSFIKNMNNELPFKLDVGTIKISLSGTLSFILFLTSFYTENCIDPLHLPHLKNRSTPVNFKTHDFSFDSDMIPFVQILDEDKTCRKGHQPDCIFYFITVPIFSNTGQPNLYSIVNNFLTSESLGLVVDSVSVYKNVEKFGFTAPLLSYLLNLKDKFGEMLENTQGDNNMDSFESVGNDYNIHSSNRFSSCPTGELHNANKSFLDQYNKSNDLPYNLDGHGNQTSFFSMAHYERIKALASDEFRNDINYREQQSSSFADKKRFVELELSKICGDNNDYQNIFGFIICNFDYKQFLELKGIEKVPEMYHEFIKLKNDRAISRFYITNFVNVNAYSKLKIFEYSTIKKSQVKEKSNETFFIHGFKYIDNVLSFLVAVRPESAIISAFEKIDSIADMLSSIKDCSFDTNINIGRISSIKASVSIIERRVDSRFIDVLNFKLTFAKKVHLKTLDLTDITISGINILRKKDKILTFLNLVEVVINYPNFIAIACPDGQLKKIYYFKEAVSTCSFALEHLLSDSLRRKYYILKSSFDLSTWGMASRNMQKAKTCNLTPQIIVDLPEFSITVNNSFIFIKSIILPFKAEVFDLSSQILKMRGLCRFNSVGALRASWPQDIFPVDAFFEERIRVTLFNGDFILDYGLNEMKKLKAAIHGVVNYDRIIMRDYVMGENNSNCILKRSICGDKIPNFKSQKSNRPNNTLPESSIITDSNINNSDIAQGKSTSLSGCEIPYFHLASFSVGLIYEKDQNCGYLFTLLFKHRPLNEKDNILYHMIQDDDFKLRHSIETSAPIHFDRKEEMFDRKYIKNTIKAAKIGYNIKWGVNSLAYATFENPEAVIVHTYSIGMLYFTSPVKVKVYILPMKIGSNGVESKENLQDFQTQFNSTALKECNLKELVDFLLTVVSFDPKYFNFQINELENNNNPLIIQGKVPGTKSILKKALNFLSDGQNKVSSKSRFFIDSTSYLLNLGKTFLYKSVYFFNSLFKRAGNKSSNNAPPSGLICLPAVGKSDIVKNEDFQDVPFTQSKQSNDPVPQIDILFNTSDTIEKLKKFFTNFEFENHETLEFNLRIPKKFLVWGKVLLIEPNCKILIEEASGTDERFLISLDVESNNNFTNISILSLFKQDFDLKKVKISSNLAEKPATFEVEELICYINRLLSLDSETSDSESEYFSAETEESDVTKAEYLYSLSKGDTRELNEIFGETIVSFFRSPQLIRSIKNISLFDQMKFNSLVPPTIDIKNTLKSINTHELSFELGMDTRSISIFSFWLSCFFAQFQDLFPFIPSINLKVHLKNFCKLGIFKDEKKSDPLAGLELEEIKIGGKEKSGYFNLHLIENPDLSLVERISEDPTKNFEIFSKIKESSSNKTDITSVSTIKLKLCKFNTEKTLVQPHETHVTFSSPLSRLLNMFNFTSISANRSSNFQISNNQADYPFIFLKAKLPFIINFIGEPLHLVVTDNFNKIGVSIPFGCGCYIDPLAAQDGYYFTFPISAFTNKPKTSSPRTSSGNVFDKNTAAQDFNELNGLNNSQNEEFKAINFSKDAFDYGSIESITVFIIQKHECFNLTFPIYARPTNFFLNMASHPWILAIIKSAIGWENIYKTLRNGLDSIKTWQQKLEAFRNNRNYSPCKKEFFSNDLIKDAHLKLIDMFSSDGF